MLKFRFFSARGILKKIIFRGREIFFLWDSVFRGGHFLGGEDFNRIFI